MVEKSDKISEQEKLLGQAYVQDSLPLAQPNRLSGGSRGTFREQNLLIVDKKNKFVPAASDDFNGDQ